MKRILILLLFVSLALVGCKDDDDDDERPASHTENRGGSMHAPGMFQAKQNCTSCHGSTLKGDGDDAPSCYSCHGQKWD